MTDIEQAAAVDADLAKKVRLKLDAAEATRANKRPDRKPTAPKVPRSFIGYLVANADYTPPARTKTSWLFHLPPLFYGVADAEAERTGFQAMAPNRPPKTVFKVTVTFEIVEDGRG